MLSEKIENSDIFWIMFRILFYVVALLFCIAIWYMFISALFFMT
jgi:hypothetical protein